MRKKVIPNIYWDTMLDPIDYPKKIKERINARNPRTGKTIHSKEKLSIAFKMSKELKYTINKNEGNLN